MNIKSFGFKIGINILKLLISTYKCNVEGYENIKDIAGNKNLVFSIYHGQIAGGVYLLRNFKNLTSIASKSKDGEIAASVLYGLGWEKVVRGSSSKNGKEALLELIKNMDEKITVVITIDGPKGPRLEVKPGIIYIAKHTDHIIVPLVFNCKHYKQFNSWDKFMFPYPFSTLNILLGEPFIVSDKIDKETINKEAKELEVQMKEMVSVHCPAML